MSRDKQTTIYAPDTNFFIQCRDAFEIEWSLVSDADKILLVVLNEVHREIDRLKSGGNTRRARRAKAVSSQLRTLIVAGQEEAELRVSGPTVALRLAPKLDPRRSKPEDYDSSSADERIAEEALACSQRHFEGNLILLSHDGMPLRAAQLMGVQVCPVPDAWLLPPEPSDQDRAIQKLNERVAALEKQAPVIALHLENEDATSITGDLVFYPELSESFVKSAVDSLKRAFPIQQRNGRREATSPFESIIHGFEPTATERDFREYEDEYNKWVQKVENYINRLPHIHNVKTDGVETVLILSNNGSTPAENLVIDVSTEGNIGLQEPVDEDDKIEIPAIPKPPKLRRSMLLGGLADYVDGPKYRDPLSNFRFSTPRPARNRHEFYWNFDKPETCSKHCRGECEDFRHGLKDERISLLLRWNKPKERSIAGAIKVVVSARNLPAPFEKTIPVRLNVEVGDSEALIRSIIQEDLGISI